MGSVKGDMTRLTIAMPTDLANRIEAEATLQDRSVSWLIRKMAIEYLERMNVKKESENG